MVGVNLSPAHTAMLTKESGLTDEVIVARGYRTIETKADLKALGFSEPQRRVPALLIPVLSVYGQIATYQIRPELPRIVNGKAIKYETPAKSRMTLDCHPSFDLNLATPMSRSGSPKVSRRVTA